MELENPFLVGVTGEIGQEFIVMVNPPKKGEKISGEMAIGLAVSMIGMLEGGLGQFNALYNSAFGPDLGATGTGPPEAEKTGEWQMVPLPKDCSDCHSTGDSLVLIAGVPGSFKEKVIRWVCRRCFEKRH